MAVEVQLDVALVAHRAEPGCAVREGVERGEVSAARYDSQLKLRAELEEAVRAW